ncbi:MAG: hypothetical protein ACK2UB_04805 [Anaerolineales bacterium]
MKKTNHLPYRTVLLVASSIALSSCVAQKPRPTELISNSTMTIPKIDTPRVATPTGTFPPAFSHTLSATPTPSTYYDLIYSTGNTLYRMTVDQYGVSYPPEEVFSTDGLLGPFDISPDGDQIVYEINGGPGEHYGIVNIFTFSTQKEHSLLLSDNFVYMPLWSPNGEFIAYVYYGPESSIRIDPTEDCREKCYVRYFRLGPNEDYGMLEDPVWLGNHHIGYFIGRGEERNFCIGDLDNLTHTCPIRNQAIGDIVISDDFQLILATIYKDDYSYSDLFMFELNNYLDTGMSNLFRITFSNSRLHSPIWSSDGKHFFYVDDTNDMRKIYFAEFTPSGTAGNEILLLESEDLGYGITLSKDEKMMAWNLEKKTDEGPISFLCVYPVDTAHPSDQVNCLRDIFSLPPQWMP